MGDRESTFHRASQDAAKVFGEILSLAKSRYLWVTARFNPERGAFAVRAHRCQRRIGYRSAKGGAGLPRTSATIADYHSSPGGTKRAEG